MKITNKLSSLKKFRYFFLPILASFFLLSVYFTLNSNFPLTIHAQTGTTFTLGSVGDMGSDSNASGVLNAVKSANLNFFLHVGDLSYNTQGSPQGWGTWVKGIVGAVFPYEIVSGNHDASQISSFVAGLPDHMQSSGTYGQNYYFDYPQTSPLVRVIMISPGLFATDTTWLGNAIDTARAQGIKWVVVGNHLNAISTGAKSNEIGTMLAFLISKKVDVILEGHDHNYQRTKQLSCVTIGSTNQSCIVNSGSTYTKGSGTVLVIDGTGGNGFYNVNAGDSEAGYFAKINSDTYGFTKITLTATQLQEQFVRTGGGSNADSFTISGSGTPVPSNNPLPTPTGVTPTFVCLGPCLTNTPTTTTSPGGPTTPISTNPQPSSPQTTLTPSTSPCPTGVQNASVHAFKTHNHKSGALSQLFNLLLQFIIKLLEQLFGINIQQPGTGTPQPTSIPPTNTSPVPSMPAPTVNPCVTSPVSAAPTSSATTAPTPSGSVTTAPTPTGSTTTAPVPT